MNARSVTPAQAQSMLQAGAILVDIREPDEFAREYIPGARNVPVSSLATASLGDTSKPIVFHCKTGARTQAHASRLIAAARGDAVVVEGGLDAWRRAGLAITADKRQPIEIMRQVMIAAGSLVLAGVLLGTFVHVGFYGLSGIVGAGLVFSGASGTCMMAHALRLMPWNRRRAATAVV